MPHRCSRKHNQTPPPPPGDVCTPQGLKALYPACGGAKALELTGRDLGYLGNEEPVHDTIIDFYIRCIPGARAASAAVAGLGSVVGVPAWV